jgi:predicted MFS family arabinose efflux permease
MIAGNLLGGRVATHPERFLFVFLALIAGAGLGSLVFTFHISLWITVLLAFGVTTLLTLAWPLTAVLLTDMAGSSRSTATGLFAVSNQLGMLGGASLGGVMLSIGGFPMIGLFCGAVGSAAAGVFRFQVRPTLPAASLKTRGGIPHVGFEKTFNPPPASAPPSASGVASPRPPWPGSRPGPHR